MTLASGDIAFVGINTAGGPDDWVAFVALADIPAGTVIYFSDNELTTATTATFNTGESYTKWTAPAAGIAAGTVVTLTNFDIAGGPAANLGTVAAVTFSGSANRGFSQTTDSVYAYLAASDATVDTPTVHLARINLGNAEDGVAPSAGSAAAQISFTTGQEGAVFSGLHSGYASFADLRTAIDNPANWTLTTGATLISTLNTSTFTASTPATIAIDDVSIAEGNSGTSVMTFTVTRSNNSGAFSVDYATADQTATAGSDYAAATGTLSFAAGGELTRTVSVTINGDTAVETAETLAVNLTNVVNTSGTATIADAQGIGTITNDDTAPATPKPLVASGDVDQDSAIVWAKVGAAGAVIIDVSKDAGFTQIAATKQVTAGDLTVPAKVSFGDLTAGTDYFYRVTDASGQVTTGKFSTPAANTDGIAGAQTHAGLTFGATGDWRGELAPYPAVGNVAAQNLDVFVILGDTIYADYASPAVPAGQATTLAEYRDKQAEVYAAHAGSNTLSDLRASTSILATIDDHEVTNDFAGAAAASTDARFNTATGLINETALYKNGVQAFTEYNPIEATTYSGTGEAHFDGKPNLYRDVSFGQDASVIVLDARSFRDKELAPVTDLTSTTQVTNFLVQSFDSSRTMLGNTQFAALKQSLLDAQLNGQTWKFVMLPEPIQNLGVLGAEDRYEGYAAERTALLRFINDNGIKNVVFISADIHGTVTNNLTYQEYPGGPQIATSAWEITTGSVAFDAPFGQTVDALGVAAGLISAQNQAFYNSLPIAPDADSTPNDKDDFIKSVVNQQVTALGYDPIGLNSNLAQANGKIDATLISGDYLITHDYGWTKFAIDPVTQELRVTTYGTPYYSAAQAAADPAAIAAQTVSVVGEFTVRAETGSVSETLLGTAGADLIDGRFGNDTIDAGAGDDGYGSDKIMAGDGIDSVFAGVGDDVVFGGAGNDGIAGEQGNDALTGDGGNDYILGGSGDDILDGGLDNDSLFGGDGFDLVNGGDGADSIDGGAGIDTIYGGAGDDYIAGGADGDNIYGDAGDDGIFGGGGIDVIRGGDGNDSLDGGADADYVYGDAGVDWIFGQTGNDSLFGAIAAEQAVVAGLADAGADILDGGAGGDILTGGAGADIFSFATAWGDDRIQDFEDGIDHINLVGLTGLTQFNQLTISQVGADTLLTFGGNSITLVATTATAITTDDVLLNGNPF
jgi:phosphodiesterase/alkaline phosphatase D-like protein